MGACATKPKVLKTDSGKEPAPAPEPVPETAATVSESKVENGINEKATEIVEDDIDLKSRSLSHLFNQNEGKDSTGNEKTSPEVKASDEDEVETEKVIETTPEEKKIETNKENEPENVEAFEEKKVDVTNDPVKTETTSEKGPEPEPASSETPTKGRSEDHKEEEVKVSIEEKVAL